LINLLCYYAELKLSPTKNEYINKDYAVTTKYTKSSLYGMVIYKNHTGKIKLFVIIRIIAADSLGSHNVRTFFFLPHFFYKKFRTIFIKKERKKNKQTDSHKKRKQ
jgi:hypothetical protein